MRKIALMLLTIMASAPALAIDRQQAPQHPVFNWHVGGSSSSGPSRQSGQLDIVSVQLQNGGELRFGGALEQDIALPLNMPLPEDGLRSRMSVDYRLTFSIRF